MYTQYSFAEDGDKISVITSNATGDLFTAVQYEDGSVLQVAKGSPLTSLALQKPHKNDAPNKITLGKIEYSTLVAFGDSIGGSSNAETFVGQRQSVFGESLTPARFVSSQLFVPGAVSSQRTSATHDGHLFSAWNTTQETFSPTAISRIDLRRVKREWISDIQSSDMISTATVDGLVNVTQIIMSPWDSALFVESMPSNITAQWNSPNVFNDSESADPAIGSIRTINQYMERNSNPMRYGYIVELKNTIDNAKNQSDPHWVRHYASGRIATGSTVIAGNGRTIYRSSAESGRLFRFVTDYNSNLGSGTLSVANFVTDLDQEKGGYNLRWTTLAHGRGEAVDAWVSDYEGMTEYDYTQGTTSYISEDEISRWVEEFSLTDINENGHIDSARDDRAVFLETDKVVALLQSTTTNQKQPTYISSLSLQGNILVIALSDDDTKLCSSYVYAHLDTEGNVTRADPNNSSNLTCESRLAMSDQPSKQQLFLHEDDVVLISDKNTLKEISLN